MTGSGQMRQVRGADVAMIFQEPMTSLNPVFTIGEQIAPVPPGDTITPWRSSPAGACRRKADADSVKASLPPPEYAPRDGDGGDVYHSRYGRGGGNRRSRAGDVPRRSGRRVTPSLSSGKRRGKSLPRIEPSFGTAASSARV
jgi:hypothetical protein